MGKMKEAINAAETNLNAHRPGVASPTAAVIPIRGASIPISNPSVHPAARIKERCHPAGGQTAQTHTATLLEYGDKHR
jgi:hypothetical protein